MNKVLALAKHPLISGSSVILTSSLIANFITYLFNLAMGRILTVAEYGLLTSLVSLTVLFSIVQTSLTGSFAKFAARFKANGDKNSLSDLIKGGFSISIIVAVILFGIMLVSLPFLQSFLHISNVWLILITFVFIFVSLISSLPNGILQGEMRVYSYSVINIIGAILRIAVAVGLVILGFKVIGALGGIVIAGFASYLLSLMFIKKDVREQKSDDVDEKKEIIKDLREYAPKFFLASLGIAMFTSLDIMLVRHFFSPNLAGQYSALAIMGKAIFYLTFPINFVFFPLIAQRKERKENVLEVLLLAIVVTAVASVCASFVYFLFPSLVLNIFFPAPSYKVLAPYLGPFSLYILVFAIASLVNNFFLSLGKTNVYKINLFCGVLLVVLICLFHTSLFQIIGSLFLSSLILLVLLLIYYFKTEKKN